MKKLHLVLLILLFCIAINKVDAKKAISQITSLDSNEAGWIDAGKYKYQNKKIGAILNLKYSQDGKSIFTYSNDKYFRKWDVESGKVIEEKFVSINNLLASDISSNGTFMILSNKDSIFKYDLLNLKFTFSRKIKVLDSILKDNWQMNSNIEQKILIYNTDSLILFSNHYLLGSPGGGSMDVIDKGQIFNLSTFNVEELSTLFDKYSIKTLTKSNNDTSLAFSILYREYNEVQRQQTKSYSRVYSHSFASNKELKIGNLISNSLLNRFDTYSFSQDNNLILGLKPDSSYFGVVNIENDSIVNKNYISKSYDEFLTCTFDKNENIIDYITNVKEYQHNTIATFYYKLFKLDRILDTISFISNSINWKIDKSRNDSSILTGASDGILRMFKSYSNTKNIFCDFNSDNQLSSNDSLINFTSKIFGNANKYFWDFGDSTYSSEINPNHFYKKSGKYSIKLIVSNDQFSDTTIKNDYIKIFSKNKADFRVEGNIGYAPCTVTFTNLSSGDIKNSTWYFGDGWVLQYPFNQIHTYEKPGIYTVKLTTSNLIYSDTKELKNIVIVKQPIKANFNSLIDKNNSFSPISATFTNTSLGSPTNYFWDFGDGESSKEVNPIHIFKNSGTFSVKLIAWDENSKDSIIKHDIIILKTKIRADFIANKTIGVPPLEVEFSNRSQGDYKYFRWEFGDGAQSFDLNPIHTFYKIGNYTVSLFVTDGPSDDMLKINNMITVLNIDTSKFKIDFYFTPNPTKGEVQLELFLSQESSCKLILFNEVGQEVKIFDLGFEKSGVTKFVFNFSELNLNEGVYFLKIIAGNENISKKIIYQK